MGQGAAPGGHARDAEPRRLRWPLYLIAAGLVLSVAWSGLFVWGLTRLAGWAIG